VYIVSSRDLTRAVCAANRAAVQAEWPVFITDRDMPAHALLKIDDRNKGTGEKPKSLLEAMDAVAGGDFEFEPPTLTGEPPLAGLG